MFKNFGTVFKFTFRNQVTQKSYKGLTLGVGIFLFAVPIIVLLLVSLSAKNKADKVLESCGADKIYVVDEAGDVSDFSIFKTVNGEGYADITYEKAATVDEALNAIQSAGEKKSFVLNVTKDENGELTAGIILPNDSSIEAKTAKHYYDAIDKMDMMFVVTIRGITLDDMTEVLKNISTDGFDVSGWKNGTSLYADEKKANEANNDRILDAFSLVITMLACVFMYIVVMTYGTSITKNIVMEKTSKLMDTLLISVKPEALVFGKLLGVLLAGLLQFFLWIALLVGGVIVGVILSDKIFPNANASLVVFLKSLGSLNLFEPGPVLLAFVVLIFGIVLYSSLSAFAGAISNTLQQATSNQGIFTMILIISYFLVIIKGVDINAAPEWLFIVPFTSPMILPTGLMLGKVSVTTAALGIGIIVVLSIVVVIVAGHAYKAMALYKGTDANLKKAFKIMSMK